jgi:hypothetical protein
LRNKFCLHSSISKRLKNHTAAPILRPCHGARQCACVGSGELCKK